MNLDRFKKKTIYFDMDGVLVDLAKGLATLEGYDDPVLWFMHAQDENGALSFQRVIEKYINEDVFVNLPPMPHFEEMKKLIYIMVKSGYNVKILSSCMDIEISDIIASQKKSWIMEHLNGLVNYEDIHIVRGSKKKIEFITDEDTFLIDDYTKTQKQFIENGLGDQFILYIGFYSCMAELKTKNII